MRLNVSLLLKLLLNKKKISEPGVGWGIEYIYFRDNLGSLEPNVLGG